jgi:uncharacterized protein YkwD
VLNASFYFTRVVHILFLLTPFLLFTSFKPAPEGLDADVLRYTNQFRKAHGLNSLSMRSDLNEIARKHSENMAKGKCSFGHSGFDQRYSKVKKIFQTCTAAENVAYGAYTGKEAVEQWKNSSPHRRNLLGKFHYIGIGTARDTRGRIYYTQIFVN